MSAAIRQLAPRGDPTRTERLQTNYAAKLRGWFGALNAVIRESVQSGDSFNIRRERLAHHPDPELTPEALVAAAKINAFEGHSIDAPTRQKEIQYAVEALQDIDPPPVFRFERDIQKRDEFLRWLRRQENRGILDIIGEDDNQFIRQAYSRSVQDADTVLNAEGVTVPERELEAVFNTPIHRRALEDLYTRNFENLDDITRVMNQQISEELTTGFARGQNPTEIARNITNRVNTIGKTRATVLARTEVINAYSDAHLNRFEQIGIREVTIRAEWLTAGDQRVCPICQSLEGETWTIQEARRGTITLTEGDVEEFVPENRSASSFTGSFPVKPPAHPACRCRLIPEVS